MIYWKISYCKQLTRVSIFSKLLFTWLLPNTDNLGRMEGDVAILKGMIFPYEEKVTVKNIEDALKELADEYLIMWYSIGGNWYIQFPKHYKYQSLEKNNSKKSDYPEPPQTLVDKYNNYFKNVEECIDMYLRVSCEGEGEEKGKEGEGDTQQKCKYAQFVSMKPEEYQKLVEEYGEIQVRRMIETLNNYKGANGKKYKSDYLAILNWVVEKVKATKNASGSDIKI